ncbi:MAG: AbrB/MazE/SpoVT family DNA-binding domain-containing protein [Candidatus Bipolaricaulota bacterium]|nr:AbrB/MazE/SpoVT family DNA-binding domain-containing protein [Candidatus Bipolaricaulota bacterium]
MPTVKVLRNGQLTLPKRLREQLHISEGDILEAEIQADAIVLRPKVLLDKDQAWQKLKAVMERVGRRHKGIPEEEIERDVLEAIRAMRRANADATAQSRA